MCGIFSWSGLKPGVFNRDKFDKLGILNETRGKHSCGIAIDGDIYIGADDTKVYRDFIAANNDIADPVRIPSVLGHTRYATIGSHTADNAHPFGFGTIDGDNNQLDYAFIGVHNGSLLNHQDLAKKYDIDPKAKSSTHKWGRDKIDSEILLEILYKTKNFKVLSDYNGAAALVWTFLSEPDIVYYYHGKSPKQEYDKVKEEERPLYYYKQTKNSLYTSSQAEGLLTIGGVDGVTLFEFDFNTVYKVTNGDIDAAVKYPISRANNYQKHGGKKPHTTPQTTTNSQCGTSTTGNSTMGTNVGTKQNCKIGSGGLKKTFAESINIYDETPINDINSYGGKVYMNKLRYWRNGHRITGFWTYIESFGFYELGQTLKEAESSFWSVVGKVFLRGEFKNLKDVTDEELQFGFIPFKNSATSPIVNPPIETFYDGVRILTTQDLAGCIGMEEVGRAFDAATLSTISKHPIIDLMYSSKEDTAQCIYLDGKLCTDIVTPMGAERSYEIKAGNLIGYTDLVKSNTVETLGEKLEKIEEQLLLPLKTEEVKESSIDYMEDDFMDSFLKKVFDNPMEHFRTQKKQLQMYLPNHQANRAIKLIEYIDNSVRNLLELEEKE